MQRLNSIEASSRAKLNFLEQLYRYHKQQGNPRVVVPTINHKPLDLWLLRKEVHKMGGYEMVNLVSFPFSPGTHFFFLQVTKGKNWPEVARTLGYTSVQGLASQIKNSYARVILPYEDFCERGRNTPFSSPSSKPAVSVQTPGKAPHSSTTPAFTGDESTASSPLTASSSPLSEPPDESESKEQVPRTRRSVRQVSVDQTTRE